MPPLQCASLDEIYPNLNKPEENVKKSFKENDNCVKDNTDYQNELKKTIDGQNKSNNNSNILKTMSNKIMDYKEFFSPNDNIIDLLEQLILIGKIIIVILILIFVKK